MKHFTLAQRYALKAYLECGKPKNEIAKLLGFDRSTIYREVTRNSKKRGAYNPDFADELAEESKERFCTHRKFDVDKQKLIENWIKSEQGSPEQIKGYCDRTNREMVPHDRTYRYISLDKLKGAELH